MTSDTRLGVRREQGQCVLLVSWGCHRKMPHMGGLNTEADFLTVPSGGQEVPDLGHGSLVFLVGALLLAYSRYLLAVSSYGRDGREQKEGEGDSSQMSFLVRTLMPSDSSCTVITSFNRNYFLKGPISKHASRWGSQGANI